LLLEDYPRNGYKLYSKIVGVVHSGLCISRLHPDYSRQKYGLDMSKRYWLSGLNGEDVISPKSLNHLLKVVRMELRAVRRHGLNSTGGVSSLVNDMNKVLKTLEQIDSLLREANSR
jgi:hypothetical protein